MPPTLSSHSPSSTPLSPSAQGSRRPGQIGGHQHPLGTGSRGQGALGRAGQGCTPTAVAATGGSGWAAAGGSRPSPQSLSSWAPLGPPVPSSAPSGSPNYGELHRSFPPTTWEEATACLALPWAAAREMGPGRPGGGTGAWTRLRPGKAKEPRGRTPVWDTCEARGCSSPCDPRGPEVGRTDLSCTQATCRAPSVNTGRCPSLLGTPESPVARGRAHQPQGAVLSRASPPHGLT